MKRSMVFIFTTKYLQPMEFNHVDSSVTKDIYSVYEQLFAHCELPFLQLISMSIEHGTWNMVHQQQTVVHAFSLSHTHSQTLGNFILQM